MERGGKESKLLSNSLLERNTYFEKGLKQLVEALEGCFRFLFLKAQGFLVKSVLFAQAPKQMNRWWLREIKETTKIAF